MAVKGGSGGMEKRKENARYLNQCFTMMVLLNCIIVLFLAFSDFRIERVGYDI